MQAHVPGLVEQHGVAGDGGEDVAEADAPLLLLILLHLLLNSWPGSCRGLPPGP